MLNPVLYVLNLEDCNKDEKSQSALTYAAKHDLLSTAELSLEAGMRKSPTLLRLALSTAISSVSKSKDVLKLLLSLEGIDLNARNAQKMTLLGEATLKGAVESAKILLNNKTIDPNLRSGRFYGMLATCNFQDPFGTCASLIMSARNPTGGYVCYQSSSWTPISLAVSVDNAEIINLLLDRKETDLRSIHCFKLFQPLHFAAVKGNVEVVDMLLDARDEDGERRADPDARSFKGWSPIMLTLEYGHLEAYRSFARVEGIEQSNATWLGSKGVAMAVNKGYEGILLALLDSAVIKPAENSLTNALLEAVREEESEIVRILLTHLAAARLNLNIKTEQDLTPLAWACKKAHRRTWSAEKTKTIVSLLLLDPRVDPEARSTENKTPLHWACKDNVIPAVESLVANAKVNVNCVDDSLRTPLYYAALKGNDQVVGRLLQDPRVEADCKDRLGRTPLTVAALRGNSRIVEMMREKGCDWDWKDSKGTTPRKLAELKKMSNEKAVVSMDSYSSGWATDDEKFLELTTKIAESKKKTKPLQRRRRRGRWIHS